MRWRKRTFSFLLPWQIHEETARQTTKHCVVQVEWPVGRADDDHVALFRRLEAVHLLHKLRDDPAVRE